MSFAHPEESKNVKTICVGRAVPEIFIFLIDGIPTVSIDHVLVVVAAADVTADAVAVTNLDLVNTIKNYNISGTIHPTQIVLPLLESQEQADNRGGCHKLHHCSHGMSKLD